MRTTASCAAIITLFPIFTNNFAMKKIYLSLFFAAFFAAGAFAQNVSFNYQAVARDQNDQPYKGTDDEPLQISVSILDGTDTEVYAEDHEDIRTSSLGIFNLRIGEGTNKTGDLANIDWSTDGPFDLEVVIRAGAASAKKLPRSRLVFVPFAIYATKAGELEGDLGGDVNGKYTNVQLNPSAVGTPEIADNAVTTGKIANGAVDNTKIGPDAVTTEKIAPLAVKTDDLDNGAVNDSKLAINAVTNSKIANGAVDNAKLANMGATDGKVLKWTAGTWSPQDDGGAALVGGAGININGNTISSVDNSATNEIQSLSFNPGNSVLMLDNGGGSADLTPITTKWTTAGSNIYRQSGNVGIGTSVPSTKLEVTDNLKVSTASNSYLLASPDSLVFLKNGRRGLKYQVAAPTLSTDILYLGDPSDSNPFVFLTANTSGGTPTGLSIFGETGLVEGLLAYSPITGSVLSADVKNFRLAHPKFPEKDIWYACIEGPEAAAYERGTATLVNGEAFVPFSEHFVEVLSPTTMTVQLTPGSANSKGLAVIEKTALGFKVKELHEGIGSYSFDWEVKGVRKGYEKYKVVRAKDTPFDMFEKD